MTKTPEETPGSSSSYRYPWAALGIAVLGFAGTALMLGGVRGLRASLGMSDVWAVFADLAAATLPLVIAVIAAVALTASPPPGGGTGIRRWRWTDMALGVAVAVVVRAFVELVAPTTGTLGGPLGGGVTVAVVIAAVAAVLVSPVVEELFFRGLVQRASADVLAGAGRVIAAIVAVAVSTAAFALMHVFATGGAAPGLMAATVAVGLACGILTAVTGRLGAAVVAHVVYNAIGIALLVW